MDKTRKHLISLAVLTAISAIVPTATFAQLHLEIAKAPEQAPKIAIIPFTNDNALYPIIENDLNRSGRFTSASQNLPATASINQIQAGDWQNAGVPYVVVGQIKNIDANTFEIHYQLYDVQKQQYLLNEVLTVPSNRVRQAGHMISDAIYQALTGIAGDFSGRIAYVLRNPETLLNAIHYKLLILMVNNLKRYCHHEIQSFLQHGHLTLKNCLCLFRN
jgi:TolB protein